MLNKLRMGAAMTLCLAVGMSAAAYAGPCDNPHDRDPANSNHLTPACAAYFADVLDQYGRWEAAEKAKAKREADWDAAHEICRQLHADASDPRTSLCRQLSERDKAIDAVNSEATKMQEIETLRRALGAEPPSQQTGR